MGGGSSRDGRFAARTWPWTRNPYDGRRHVLDWFMWRVATVFKGREVRLPFGNSTWKVTDEPPY